VTNAEDDGQRGAIGSRRDSARTWIGLIAIVAASGAAGRHGVPAALNALLVVGLLIAAVCSPAHGFAALFAGAMLSPWAFKTGTDTNVSLVLPLLAALCAGWLVGWWRRGDWSLLRLGPLRALIAFAAIATTSCGIALLINGAGCGRHAPVPAQLGGLAGLVLPAGAFAVAADRLDCAWVRRLVWLFVGLGGAYLVWRLVPLLPLRTGVYLAAHADGSLFWVWLVALASGQAIANQRLHAEWRLAVGWVVVLALYTALGNLGWLSGWVPALVALAVVVAAAAPRVAGWGAIAALLAAAASYGYIAPRIADQGNLYSLSTRRDAAAIVLRLIELNPLLGLGPANYYHCTPLLPIRGYTVHFSSHNNYLDLVAQTGVLGLACVLAFAATCAVAGIRLVRRADAGFTRGFACGCLGGLAGTLVAALLSDWWLPFVYNITLDGLRSTVASWVFLGALVGLSRGAR
jgi:hypothetical protein